MIVSIQLHGEIGTVCLKLVIYELYHLTYLFGTNRLPGWPDNDPSLGSVGENNVWNTDGEFKGLTLQVLNNLEENSDWTEHFEMAISEWDNGTPDAVTLYLRSSTYDPDCRAVRKAMKVCNGNYGPTDWRGVNQILLQDEYIITSLAKMNDYYLDGTNKAQKQYTVRFFCVCQLNLLMYFVSNIFCNRCVMRLGTVSG